MSRELRRLLDDLHDARARRDGAPRDSQAWLEADREIHRLEAAIVRGGARGGAGEDREAGQDRAREAR
jgi:hypothetical protein